MNPDSRSRILIIDDSQGDIDLLGSILGTKYDVRFALAGSEGLDLAIRDLPDLILLDVVMPVMDGFEVCRRLKTDPATRDIPVIFLAKPDSVVDEEHGLSLGAEDFIRLPLSPPLVQARVRNQLLLADAKRMEPLLAQREYQFRTLAENSPDVIVRYDREGRRIYVNPEFERVNRLSAQEVYGKRPLELSTELKPLAAVFTEKLMAAMASGSVAKIDLSWLKDGKPIWWFVRVVPEFDAHGKVTSALTIWSDITERKQTEEALHRLNRELRAISNCNQSLMRAEDEQTLLDAICRIVCDEAGYRMAWVGYAENDDAKTIRPVAWAGIENGYLAQAAITWADTERGRGPSGTAMRSGSSIRIQDFSSDASATPWREDALQRGYRSNIALPLKDESANTFGVLTIYASEPNVFTPDETRLLEQLAGDLAFGITTLRARIERARIENINMARLRLLQFAASHPLDELLQATLDEAEKLSGSVIGFYHFLDADQEALLLQQWSSMTKEEFCKAEGLGLHYDVSEAGVWVDCIRERRAIIHNDYASLPHRKGMPPGHAEVVRELVVPVFRGESIVAILGVGNKPQNYTARDVETISVLADLAWEMADRKRLEMELGELNQTLARRVDEEVANNREKDHLLIQQSRLAAMGEMVHNIAHQWRQPLAALSILLSNIQDDYDYHELTPEILDKSVEKGQLLLHGMSTTIDDFRDFFRPDQEPGEFDMRQSAADALFVMEAALKDNFIEIERDMPEGLTAYGYSHQFAQVVLNVLANAKEAIFPRMTSGGRIRISLKRRGNAGILTIADNGGGIPDDILPKIFDPYFTTKDKGSGIGLYMSKMIVERNLNGKIEAANTEQGALISVTLSLRNKGAHG